MEDLWRRLAARPGFSEFPLLTATVERLAGAPFFAAFSGAVEDAYAAGRLTAAGRQLLLEFGDGCGRYDYLRQQEHIRHYCRRLADLERELASQAAVKGRLYRVVGAALGGGLALLLL